MAASVRNGRPASRSRAASYTASVAASISTAARQLVLDRLEIGDRLAELFARPGTRWRAATPLGQPDHLGADADPSFVQRLDRGLVAFA